MKVFSVALLVLLFVVLHSECSPRHVRKTQKSTRQHSLNSTLSDVIGSKRFVGMVTAAFSAFNNIANFMGSCNNVVGWFDNINRFLGSGGTEDQSQVTIEKIEEVKQEINQLADDVQDGFNNVLAGQEYANTLTSLTPHINMMRIIEHLEEEYLENIEGFRQDLSNPGNEQSMRRTKERWFSDVANRLEALKNALIILHENICSPFYSQYSLYEAHANKIGKQDQGGLIQTMGFITKIRKLEATGYGVWKSHLKEKEYPNEGDLEIDLEYVDNKIKDIAECENPAIARTFTSIIDHQGTPSFGLIQWSHNYEYKRYDSPTVTKYKRCMAVVGERVQGKPCQTSDTSQQWKLLSDNTLHPKIDETKCLFLVQANESKQSGNRERFPGWGHYVIPCNSNFEVKTFKFQYLTHYREDEPLLHTFFKIQTKFTDFEVPTWRGRNFCLSFRDYTHDARHNTSFVWKSYIEACTERDNRDPSPEGIGGYMGESPPRNNDFGWYKFIPVEE